MERERERGYGGSRRMEREQWRKEERRTDGLEWNEKKMWDSEKKRGNEGGRDRRGREKEEGMKMDG